MTDRAIASRLEKYREEIITIMQDVSRMLRFGSNAMIYERARSYWIAHILGAAGDDNYKGGSMVDMTDTIEELQKIKGEDDEEGEDGEEGEVESVKRTAERLLKALID